MHLDLDKKVYKFTKKINFSAFNCENLLLPYVRL